MKFFKILFTILFTLVFLEIGLRLLKPKAIHFYWIQRQIHKYDPDYYVDLEPNLNLRIQHFLDWFDIQFSTNERGYRATASVDNTKPQIICIGDSIAMGYGVNDKDVFCSMLDNYKDSLGNEYQVINLSVDAYGSSAIALKLKKHLPTLNAKVIYYFPSVGDDVDEASFYQKKNSTWNETLFKLQFQATKLSYLILALKVTQEQLFIKFQETFIFPYVRFMNLLNCMKGLKPKDECPISNWKELILDFYYDLFKPKKTDEPIHFPESECEESQESYPIPESSYQSTKEIIELSKRFNTKLVLFLLPINPEIAYCSQKGKVHKYYDYLKEMKKFFEKEKLDYIDFNQPEYTLRMKDEKGRLNVRPYYIIGDGHYTALGNKWIFEILLQKTKEVLP